MCKENGMRWIWVDGMDVSDWIRVCLLCIATVVVFYDMFVNGSGTVKGDDNE